MKLALASDHAGYPLKNHLVAYLSQQGHEVLDLGVSSADVASDYPDASKAVAEAVLDGRAERAVLACGSGVGACIAANKFPGIYAAICHDTYSAHQGVEHDQMNILCVGARIVGEKLAEELVDAFVRAHFSGEERHQRRFAKVQAIEHMQLNHRDTDDAER
jgi:ribose 5-phosphate isomerase B